MNPCGGDGMVPGNHHVNPGRRPYDGGGGRCPHRVSPADLEKAQSIFGVDNPFNHLEYEASGHVHYFESVHRINNCLGVCHMNTIHWDIEQIDLPNRPNSIRSPRMADIRGRPEAAGNAATQSGKGVQPAAYLIRRKDDLPTRRTSRSRSRRDPLPAGNWTRQGSIECSMNITICTAGTGKRVFPPVKSSPPWGSNTSPTTWKGSASWTNDR